MANVRIGSVVNNILAPIIATLGSALVAWLVNSLRRWLVSGIDDLKSHLTQQDTKIEGLSNRISRIEGRMDSEWQSRGRRRNS